MMISVIMPVYNEKISELQSSINSILSQSYKNFEFIIVDDNPKSINIKKFLLSESKRDNRIKLYFNSKNMGAMITANRAISKASGKYIARMDADDIAYRNRLKEQLQFCLKYKLDFSSCNFVFAKGKSKQYFVYSDTLLSNNQIKHLMYYTNLATGPTLFFNRKLVKSIGGYRNILAEDYDLAIRMIVYGFNVGYLSKPLVYKRYRNDGLSESKSLSTFTALHLIKKYSKKTRFNKILSESYIKNRIKSIKETNTYYYDRFINSCYLCDKRKSIKNLLRKYWYAVSTPFLFKRNLIVFRNKSLHLLKRYFYNLKY